MNKAVEVDQVQVAVPIEKERVVVERTTPNTTEAVASPGAKAFREDNIMQMEVYEETADIQKRAFVREEVKIRKEVQRDTVKAKEKVRREKLNVNIQGQPIVEDKI